MTQEEKTPASTVAHAPWAVWRGLLKTTEGRILLLGVATALTGLAATGLIAFWSPATSRMIGAMVLANIFFGRAAAMFIGYAGGYGHAVVIPVNLWVETVMVLLFYPLFVFSARKLVVIPRLKIFIERTQAAAERHHNKVRRYGIPGLFIFVWLPFWMTGPVVGSAIGYLLGFPSWLTLLVVLAGTFAAMGSWAYLLFDVYERAAFYGPWASVLILGLIILIILAGYLLNQRGNNHKAKASE